MKTIKNLIPIAFVVCLHACKSDDGPKPQPPKAKTKTELLTTGTWKINTLTVEPGIEMGGKVVTNFLSLLQNCTLDDFRKFNANGSGVDDEGATKCDPSDPQTTPFTWAFSSNETKITEDGTDVFDIIELTETSYKLSATVDGDDIGGTSGVKYKMTATFKH